MIGAETHFCPPSSVSTQARGAKALRAPAIGVLAALLFCLAAALALAAPAYPALTGRVVDQANVIPAPTRMAITAKLKGLEDKSGVQFVVATIEALPDADIETYANGLFRAWKLGEAKKNNGVLFLVAPNERKMRIEVGYGLEGTLTDAISKIIVTTAAAPRFKAGDYGGGIERAVDAVIEVLSAESSEWTKRAKTGVKAGEIESLVDLVIPFLILALFVYIFLIMANNARGGRPRSYRDYRRGGGPIIIFPPDDDWPQGDGWGSGGSSWGGGDDGISGGGGSSGGGGASGDW